MLYQLRAFCCLYLTASWVTLAAQDGYRPGGIYSNGKAVRSGFVRFFPSDGDKRLVFKKYLDDFPEEFLLTELDSFYVEGEGRFLSADVPVTSFAPVDPRTTSVGANPETEIRKVCLRRLIVGDSICLYECAAARRLYYTIPSDPHYVELLYCVFVNQSQLDGYETEVRTGDWSPGRYRNTVQFFGYRDSLRRLTGIHHRLRRMVDEMPYIPDSLVSFARKYNTKTVYRAPRPLPKKGPRFFAGTGIALTSVSFVSPGYGNFRPVRAGSFPAVTLNAGCVFLPRDEAKISQWRLSAAYFHYSGRYDRSRPGSDSISYLVSSTQVVLSGGALFRLLRFPSGGGFSAGGMYNQRLLYSSSPDVFWRDREGNTLVSSHSSDLANLSSFSLCSQLMVGRSWEAFLHWTPPFFRLGGGEGFTRVDSYTAGLSVNYIFK